MIIYSHELPFLSLKERGCLRTGVEHAGIMKIIGARKAKHTSENNHST
jgi:hypothetical protein